MKLDILEYKLIKITTTAVIAVHKNADISNLGSVFSGRSSSVKIIEDVTTTTDIPKSISAFSPEWYDESGYEMYPFEINSISAGLADVPIEELQKTLTLSTEMESNED